MKSPMKPSAKSGKPGASKVQSKPAAKGAKSGGMKGGKW